MEHVINGEGLVLGRLSSQVAKMLLNGDSVTVVNADKLLVSGHVHDLVSKYKRKIELKDKGNPEHSPYISRRPDMFVKRIVRGMLPYKKPSGKSAYKRLKIYVRVPETLDGKAKTMESKHADEVFENVVTVKKLTEMLGYR